MLSSNSLAYESEDKLKSIIIGKLAKYITWNTASSESFVITILQNPFGDLLDKSYQDKKIKSKAVKIKYIDKPDELEFTHILYIPQVNQKQLEQILKKANQNNVLTISDSRGFAEKGGIVQVYFVSQKVKLKINLDIAKAENLMISSALLRIATVVREGH